MAEKKLCFECKHFREPGKPVNPLSGVRLVSKKVLELRAKWQQELATRALFEQERYQSGVPFDYEPSQYAYCAHFSTKEVMDPVTGEKRPYYALCGQQNPTQDCGSFARRGT